MRSDARRNRDAVLDVALGVLADRPTATMQEIADASDVGRTTVYRHFASREELLEALNERAREAIRELRDEAVRTGGTHAERMRAFGRAIIPVGARYRYLSAHPESERQLLETVVTDPDDPMRTYLKQAQAAGDVRDDVTVQWLMAMIHGVARAALDELALDRADADSAGALLGEMLIAITVPRYG